MDWTHMFTELEAFLSDHKIRCDVAEYLEAVCYRLEVDGETVVFPQGTRVLIEERMLARNLDCYGGGYLLVKLILLPPIEEGKESDGAHLGRLKIQYDLEGRFQDDFYSLY